MTASLPRAGLGAVTAACRTGHVATLCRAGFRTPGRATASGATSQATAVSPYAGRSAQLRVLDLFSGIGGFSLGLERTGGFKTVQFCEIDPFCRRVLAKHWPDVPCHDDVTTMQFHEDMADVITGGFPCQDISYAGLGAGLAGERSGLYRHLVDAIRVVRPRYAIMENVAALLGRGLDVVLGDLAEIGYDAECHCIPASAVGAPHRRDRVWIVAHPYGRASGLQHVTVRKRRDVQVTHVSPHPHAAPLQWPSFLGDEPHRDHAGAGEVADAIGERCQGISGQGEVGIAECGEALANTDREGLQIPRQEQDGADGQQGGRAASPGGWWSVEPDVGRVAARVPLRVDRLRALGNAIVPQLAEIIGQAILTADQQAARAA